MSRFRDDLTRLVSKEMVAASVNPDRLAEMVEAMISSLSFTIAVGTKGNRDAASTLLEGSIAHLTETVTAHSGIAGVLFERGRA